MPRPTLRQFLASRVNKGPGVITHTELREVLAANPDPSLYDALEHLAGWLDAASSPDEPLSAVTGKVSASVLARRIREILVGHPERHAQPMEDWRKG
ncbi:hypothetical protein [Arthrobacter sp. efr-133-R2A-120]|uniref:hypothetical protein n=1 Tax=Arthrobacter sp. efr-133-R2A-120 TaxID=3040277 RepID=UPI00254F0417|nr:hypothetical protein [Arthrobacter sp. efr-133-R2A-120]